jgi:hypothetical protein
MAKDRACTILPGLINAGHGQGATRQPRQAVRLTEAKPGSLRELIPSKGKFSAVAMVRVCGNSARQLCWGSNPGQLCWGTSAGWGNSAGATLSGLPRQTVMAQLVFKAAANDQSDRPEGLGIGLLAMQPLQGLIAWPSSDESCAYACSMTRGNSVRNFANTLIWPRLRGHCLAIVAIAFIGRCQDAHQQRTRRFMEAPTRPGAVTRLMSGVLEWWITSACSAWRSHRGRPTSRYFVSPARPTGTVACNLARRPTRSGT